MVPRDTTRQNTSLTVYSFDGSNQLNVSPNTSPAVSKVILLANYFSWGNASGTRHASAPQWGSAHHLSTERTHRWGEDRPNLSSPAVSKVRVNHNFVQD